MRSSLGLPFFSLLAWNFVVSIGASGCLGEPDSSNGDTPVPPKGCAVEGGTPPPTAPNGYYTNGATVCTANATPHQFHGVDRPSLEWSTTGQNVAPADFMTMASWGANVVRVALNQDFWLSGAALNDPTYPATVDKAVAWAEAAGLDVILDLHWSDAGDLTVTSTQKQGPGNSNQQNMADVNSIEFWKEVASRYKNDGRVLFELYNEPHGITWDLWLNGGQSGGYAVAGMQQLYDAVRGAGANNVVIAGGLDWAYDLSGVGPGASYVQGYNVMYATHPYISSAPPSAWEGSFGHLATTDFAPVVVTEFGDGRNGLCTGDYDQQLIAFANARGISWTAWAWYPKVSTSDPQGCSFPSLILDWSGTPSVQGVVVEAALQAYPHSNPPIAADAGPSDAGSDAIDGAAGDSNAIVEAAGDSTAIDGDVDATLTLGTDGAAGPDSASVDGASDSTLGFDEASADVMDAGFSE
ncbi:MAG: glycoside hydrolase family 5 protein [Polyangiaceae bacterium]